MLAAVWNTISRCWPTVVPGLPPTGVAAVGSLNPSFAPSVLMIVMVTARLGTVPSISAAITNAPPMSRRADRTRLLPRRRGTRRSSGRHARARQTLRRRRVVHAAGSDPAARIHHRDGVLQETIVEPDHHGAVGKPDHRERRQRTSR